VYFFYDREEKLINKFHHLPLDKLKLTYETDVLRLLVYILDIIALKFAVGYHKPVAMIFAVNFELLFIILLVGDEPCYIKHIYTQRFSLLYHPYFLNVIITLLVAQPLNFAVLKI
jgi:hypothetical protein